MSGSKHMKDGLACRQEIVTDDPPVAPPAHCLRAHDGATPVAREFAQVRETGAKALARRVVGIIMKALVLPVGVDIRRDIAVAATQSAKRRNVLISDSVRRQRPRQYIAIKLRVGARAR